MSKEITQKIIKDNNFKDDKPLNDLEFTKEFHRFQTKDKSRAFNLMEKLEEEEEIKFTGIVEKNGRKLRRYVKTSWRTSMNFSDRIAFDIDSHDVNNLKTIVNYYEGIFKTKFIIVKSKHGYHLITKDKYNSHASWQYDVCRVLYPLLEKNLFQKYKYEVDKFYKQRKDERDKKELTRKELQELTKDFEEKFRESGLYCGIGDFEILFAVNAIMRDFYSLRISKKSKNDNPILIKNI